MFLDYNINGGENAYINKWAFLCQCNMSQILKNLKILGAFAKELDLKLSNTAEIVWDFLFLLCNKFVSNYLKKNLQ